MTAQYFAGLMSGTSIDAFDFVIADFSGDSPQLVFKEAFPIENRLRQRIIELQVPSGNELAKMLEMDLELGKLFASAVNTGLGHAGLAAGDIIATGSHGQTIRHQPDKHYTLQIGNGSLIASETGITTITDFRMADMVAGGQGAPLLPAFHNELFRSLKHHRCIVNLGGMANITLLPASSEKEITGFDTGPANVLMDYWISKKQGETFDREGDWASSGSVDSQLLNALLEEPYFSLAPPKSTGRELFDGHWLEDRLGNFNTSDADIQATLCELTARTVVDAILASGEVEEVFCCGGGAHNSWLLQRLSDRLGDIPLASTGNLGVDPDWVEATAFAWFAKKRIEGKPASCPSVTGASKQVVMGAIHHP